MTTIFGFTKALKKLAHFCDDLLHMCCKWPHMLTILVQTLLNHKIGLLKSITCTANDIKALGKRVEKALLSWTTYFVKSPIIFSCNNVVKYLNNKDRYKYDSSWFNLAYMYSKPRNYVRLVCCTLVSAPAII